VIERWLDTLGTLVKDDWRDQPLAKINNHEYWAAWAAMATGVALNRRDLYDWAVTEYRIAARQQVDKDGFLPNELARDTRALAYHNYSLEPLAMIAAFARANGDDLASEGNGALSRLATRVLAGAEDPRMFEARTGKKQVMDDLEDPAKFAWLEPYCSLLSCEGVAAQRLKDSRPLKSYRMGGDLTELFGGA
jgi:poly(beta-D-mannuronate) lyase